MDNLNSAVQVLIHGSNTLFILLGAVMVLAMHAGFAFLEVGTVRLKNQVNALSKILSDFAISALAYFFVGYWIAYGVIADAKTKVYGDADPSLTYQVSGLKNGDSAGSILTGGLNRAAGENVGVYGINQGDLALNSGNYDLSYQGNNLTITKALLNVIADAKTKVYGDADPALTYQVSGLKNGDTAGAVLNGGSLSRVAGENVGVYGINQGGLALNSGNYDLSYQGNNLTITKALLNVIADGKTKVYGAPTVTRPRLPDSSATSSSRIPDSSAKIIRE